MAKYQLDLVFDQHSGQVEFLIDIIDTGRSMLEMQEGIEDGSLREEVISNIEILWGPGMAGQVRSGEVGMRCTDTSPKDRAEVKSILKRHRLNTPEERSPASNPENLSQAEGARERQAR